MERGLNPGSAALVSLVVCYPLLPFRAICAMATTLIAQREMRMCGCPHQKVNDLAVVIT